MYVYHCHAVHYKKDGLVQHFDGVISRSIPIETVIEYWELKGAVAAEMKMRGDPTKLIIMSLTLIHKGRKVCDGADSEKTKA